MCAVGIVSEPKYGSLRNWLTKSITLILVLDDVFDASGCTLEELENFTSALNRFDSHCSHLINLFCINVHIVAI